MASGDGLILRIRPKGPVAEKKTLETLSDLAERYGNGEVELTRRANFQLRGLQESGLDAVRAALREADLLDRDPKTESRRNILVSPMAGLDPAAGFDAFAVHAALEDKLQEGSGLAELPAKFLFLIDDGGEVSLRHCAADLRIESFAGEALVSVAGAQGPRPLARVPIAAAAATAVRIAAAFASTRPATVRRMVELDDLGDLCLHAGLSAVRPAERARSARTHAIHGVTDRFIGLGVAFGTLSAAQLRLLARMANGEIRLTPWRTVLLPFAAPSSIDAFARAGFVTRETDPVLRAEACVGAPRCLSGQGATRELASTLVAEWLAGRPGLETVHVSGCRKGCARSAAASVTIVASGLDAYDLISNGRADARPLVENVAAADLSRVLHGLEDARRLAS